MSERQTETQLTLHQLREVETQVEAALIDSLSPLDQLDLRTFGSTLAILTHGMSSSPFEHIHRQILERQIRDVDTQTENLERQLVHKRRQRAHLAVAEGELEYSLPSGQPIKFEVQPDIVPPQHD